MKLRIILQVLGVFGAKAKFKRLLFLVIGVIGVYPSLGQADVVSISCSSATTQISSSGGTSNINVDCIINAPNATSNYRITPSTSNYVTPSTLLMLNGLNTLTATRQSIVSSPDSSVTSISGSASGFNASVTSSSAPKTVRFQYQVTTTSNTLAGTYTANVVSYQYQVCTTSNCHTNFTGVATTPISVKVAASPVTVSCSSPSLNATPGGGNFSLNVVCTASGGNPSMFSPSASNTFSPSTMTLSNGTHTLSASLQPTVTSPDNSVTNISGTASGGFTGNINAMPAKVQVQYAGTTSSSTAAGTYTSSPVTWIWSTL